MKKTLSCHIPVLAPSGQTMVPITIAYDDKEVVTNPHSEVTLLYDGVEYKGRGSDYLWTDTLADLQRNLPKDVKIACCMTCRHGNMCPYGNVPNELFCTKELIITGKNDMIHLFDQTDPFKERAVASLDYCDDFVYQSDAWYTYNDYLDQLNKKNLGSI